MWYHEQQKTRFQFNITVYSLNINHLTVLHSRKPKIRMLNVSCCFPVRPLTNISKYVMSAHILWVLHCCAKFHTLRGHSCFVNPSVITGDRLRPDLLLVTENRCLYILELTVGYESNLQVNANRKRQKYLDLIKEQEADYDKVKFVNLSLSTLGVFSRSSENFDGMLRSLKCDAKFCKYIKKKIVNMCIRTSYYIFCKRNKVWDNPKLMSI